MNLAGNNIQVFTNPHRTWDFKLYKTSLERHKILNDQMGFDGTLLFTSHHDFYDPWVSAQWLCQGTAQIPLIALNPIYFSPFVAARKASSLMSLYQRELAINWITGTAKNDLEQMGDILNKVERYARLAEYIELFELYLSGKVFSYSGKYYSVENAHLRIPQDANFRIRSYLAGSSQSVQNLVKFRDAVHLQMLPNPNKLSTDLSNKGFALGLILGNSDIEAKSRAMRIFAMDRMGEKSLEMALNNTDSEWKHELAENFAADIADNGYWTKPLKNFSEVPFLVLSIDKCRTLFKAMNAKGLQHLVISLADEADYQMLRKCFD